MILTWDEAKRLANLRKHGFDFADAELVFTGETITYPDNRYEYDEERWITFGLFRDVVVAIAHTETGDKTRIISFRKATKHEQQFYFQNFAD